MVARIPSAAPPARVRAAEWKVLVADDHALIRLALRQVVEALPGFAVVGEASTGQEVLDEARRLEPDLVLLDISLPGVGGLDVAAQLARERPAAKVLVVSAHSDRAHVLEALRVGVRAYVCKGAGLDDLRAALSAVAEGHTFFCPTVLAQVVHDYLDSAGGGDEPRVCLTARQQEVLALIADGHSTKEIAWRLGLSTKTVEAHRAQIMARLNVNNVAGLVRYAVREGFTSRS